MKRGLVTIAIALGGAAAFLVLQTLAYRLAGPDSGLDHALALVWRLAFFASDVAFVVGLVLLGRADETLRPFTWTGLAIGAFTIGGELLGLLGRLGPDMKDVASTAHVMGSVEPVMSLGATFATVLVLGGVARKLEITTNPARAWIVRRFVGVTFAALAISFLFRIARATAPTMVSLAWVAWVLEIAPRALLAAIAWLATKALTAQDKNTDPPKGGFYRAPDTSLDAPKATRPRPDPETLQLLHTAAIGLGKYRSGFLLRMIGGIAVTFVGFIAASMGRDGGIVLILSPLVTFVATIMMVRGLTKVLPVRHAIRANGTTRGALVFLILNLAVDGFAVVACIAVAVMSSWSVGRDIAAVALIAGPFSSMAGWISVALLAGALDRAGAALEAPAVVVRARVLGAMVVFTIVVSTGFVFAISSVKSARHATGSEAGGVVALALGVGILCAIIGILVTHVRLLNEARLAFVAEATTS